MTARSDDPPCSYNIKGTFSQACKSFTSKNCIHRQCDPIWDWNPCLKYKVTIKPKTFNQSIIHRHWRTKVNPHACMHVIFPSAKYTLFAHLMCGCVDTEAHNKVSSWPVWDFPVSRYIMPHFCVKHHHEKNDRKEEKDKCRDIYGPEVRFWVGWHKCPVVYMYLLLIFSWENMTQTNTSVQNMVKKLGLIFNPKIQSCQNWKM